jgi:hypothetical protein
MLNQLKSGAFQNIGDQKTNKILKKLKIHIFLFDRVVSIEFAINKFNLA